VDCGVDYGLRRSGVFARASAEKEEESRDGMAGEESLQLLGGGEGGMHISPTDSKTGSGTRARSEIFGTSERKKGGIPLGITAFRGLFCVCAGGFWGQTMRRMVLFTCFNVHAVFFSFRIPWCGR